MTTKNSLREEYESIAAQRRSRFLENLLKESILNVLAEQQQTPVPPPPAPPAAPPTPPPAPAPAPGADPNAAPGTSKDQSVTALVDSLNVIRGGKSLTDPEVLSGISNVFKSLTGEQKTELVSILDMLSKAVDGTAAPQPDESQGAPAPSVSPPPAPPAAPPAPAPSAPISPTGA